MKKITLSVLLALLLAASATGCATPDAPSRGTMEDTKQPSNNGADVTTASDDTKPETESHSVTETEAETNLPIDDDDTLLDFTPSNPDDFDFEIGYEPLTEPVTRGGKVKIVMSIKNNSGEDFVVREDYCTDTIYTLKTVTPDGEYRVPAPSWGASDHGYPTKDVLAAGETKTTWKFMEIPLDAPAGSYTLWFKFKHMNQEMTVENFFVLDELPAEEPAETAE